MIFLGIDCGTQSTKTIALDGDSRRILATAQQAYGFVSGLPPGAMEQNPSDWIAAADATIRSVLEQLGTRITEVRGIGVSGQQHGLVALDDAGEVVRPAKLWCDTSTVEECEEIERHFGGTQALIALAGNAMLPGYTAPKILWLRKNEPENWERTRTVLLPHDYLNWWLTGTFAMEYGDASGTALLDVRTRDWADPVVEFVASDLTEKLPPLRSSLERHGELQSALRTSWGLEPDVIVSAGGGDNMMGAIGTGNTAPGVVTASLGTSGTLYAFATQPVVDSQGEVAAFCDSSNHWLPLVCTMNVTLVTEMTRTLFAWDHAANDAAVASVPAGSDGLLMLPYLTGERTPNLPDGCGVLHGLNTQNFTAPHLARAAMEGVTLGLGYGLQRFRDLGVLPQEIRLTGGGSNSPVWRQICADVFGVPVVCLESGEGAGLGAAIQAAWLHGSEQGSNLSLADFTNGFVRTDPATRAQPGPATARYPELLGKANQLRTALSSVNLL